MPKNPHLVPTTVMDKNGKVTTVHKKPVTAAAAPALPSPSLTMTASIDDLKGTVVERSAELYDMHHQTGFDYRPYLANELQQLSVRDLNTVSAVLEAKDDLAHAVAEHLITGTPTSVKETLHYHDRTGFENYWETEAALRAMEYYSSVNQYEDLTAVNERTQQQCVALMKTAKLIDTLPQSPSPHLLYVDGNAYYDCAAILNTDLQALIADRPQDAERIAAIVLEHSTSNAAAINGIMEGEYPALAEGHL